MSASGPKQTWTSAPHTSAFGGQSGHGFLHRTGLLLTQRGREAPRYWTSVQLDFATTQSIILWKVRLRVSCRVMSEDKIILSLSERCRALAEQCRSKAQSFRNVKPRTQMLQLAADYEHKANLAEALETSLRTPYDQNAPLPEIFEAFLTPSEH